MKWFRFYSQALHDAKVQSLSLELFRAWVNLLCLANEGPDRGRLPDLKQIAFALHMKEAKAAQILGRLADCGLIDTDEDGGFRPHNWDKWQRGSDDVNRRVKEHRHRSRTVSGNDNVTLHVRGSNSRVRADSETDTDTDSDKTPLPPQGDGVCVSINGGEPIPIEDAPAPVQPVIDEAELTRVGQRAERLFPMADFGPKIRGIAGDGPSEFPLAWIDAALTEMHSGNVHTWSYLVKGILRRYAEQGGPARASPATPTPADPVETPEQKAARIAKATEGMKAYRAQLAQEGRSAPRR